MHRRLIIALTAVALVLAGGDLALWQRAGELRALQSRWNTLAAAISVRPPRFRPEMVTGLPLPAQRYLRHAIARRTPLRATVRLDMAGRMTAPPGDRWYPFSAHEILVAGRGFVWQARVQGRPLFYVRSEAYLDGTGERSVSLLGVVPWRRWHAHDVSAVNRALLALQSVWDPASLLPFRGVQWKRLDAAHVVATLDIDGRAVPVTLEISPHGELRAASVRCPCGHDHDGRFTLRVHEQMRSAGYRVPRRVTATWRAGSGRDRAVARSVVILGAQYR